MFWRSRKSACWDSTWDPPPEPLISRQSPWNPGHTFRQSESDGIWFFGQHIRPIPGLDVVRGNRCDCCDCCDCDTWYLAESCNEVGATGFESLKFEWIWYRWYDLTGSIGSHRRLIALHLCLARQSVSFLATSLPHSTRRRTNSSKVPQLLCVKI